MKFLVKLKLKRFKIIEKGYFNQQITHKPTRFRQYTKTDSLLHCVHFVSGRPGRDGTGSGRDGIGTGRNKGHPGPEVLGRDRISSGRDGTRQIPSRPVPIGALGEPLE